MGAVGELGLKELKAFPEGDDWGVDAAGVDAVLGLLWAGAGLEVEGVVAGAGGAEVSAGIDETVVGGDAPLEELVGGEVVVGPEVSDTVEVCANANVIGEKMNDAIKVPTSAFLATVVAVLILRV